MTEAEKSLPPENSDIICLSILDSLSQIEKLLLEPSNQTVFDLKTDALTSQAFHELSNLQLSLDQYSGRDRSLTYYGFIGHFSAGKTTTINSLLDTDDPRPTNQHPTDTSVTIIAHKNNQASLIGAHRRGTLAVSTSLRGHDLLLNAVIVDTPGSGDPTIVEEMVRDFLPICDTLVYVLSATAPLDNSDVPTLIKASNDLPFIPVQFVVTRADEFRKDIQNVFSIDNYDQDKGNDFCVNLSRRLQSTIPGLSVSPEDIMLIDNISNFNIDSLRKVISSDEKMDADQVLKLHTHKITYFAQSADHIRTIFVDHVKSKVEALHSFLDDARANHSKFLKVETMASSNLTESWKISRNSLDKQNSIETESISDLDFCSDLPVDIRNAISLQDVINDTKRSIDEFSERLAKDICRRTKKILIQEHDKKIEKLRNDFNKMDDSDFPVFSSLPLSGLANTELFDLDIDLQRSLTYQIHDLPKEAEALVRRSISVLFSNSKRLVDRISSDVATSTTRETINNSIEQLRLMLEDFFESVHVYQAAILAINARSTAQVAGIVDTIEELEKSELTPAQRTEWLTNITESIFPSWSMRIVDFDTSITHLTIELNTLIKTITNVRTKPIGKESEIPTDEMLSMEWVKSDPQIVAQIEFFITQYQYESDKLFSVLNEQQKENMSIEADKLIKDKLAIRELQNKKIQKYVLLPAFLASTSILLYFLWPHAQPTNLATSFIANFSFWLFIALLSKVWDRTTEKITEREQQYHKSALEIASNLLNDDSAKLNLDFIESKQLVIKDVLSKHLNSSTDSLITKYAVNPFANKYNEIREISQSLEEVGSKYLDAVKTLTMSFETYYSNTGVNLSALEKVSTDIRTEAIEPSFDMLQEQDVKLTEIYDSLVGIDIMMNSK